MEDFNSEVVQEWVKAQADFTNNTLAKLPGRQAFFNRMVELDASILGKVDCVLRFANGKVFYLKCEAQDDVWKLYMRDGIDGAVTELELPFNGTVNFFGNDQRLSCNDPRVEGILLGMTSWTKFISIYQYNPLTQKFIETHLQPKGQYDAPDDLIAEEIEVQSHDGTMVPMSIVYKKGIKRNGSNPCWLTGYGAYGRVRLYGQKLPL